MPTLITFKILNNKERLVSHFIDEQLKHREDKCCVACPGSHSKRGGGHTRILGSLGSLYTQCKLLCIQQPEGSFQKQSLLCHSPAPNPPVAPYCPWDEDKILPLCLQTLSTPSSFCPPLSVALSTLLHWPFVFPEHFTLLLLT